MTGQPIPDPDADGGYLQYEGQPVLTTLDAQALRELAGVTPGGRYVNVATGNFDLGVLYTQLIAGADRQLLERTEREVFQERFQPFLAAALVLLALEFLLPDLIRRRRRGREASGRAAPAGAVAVLFALAAAFAAPVSVQAVGVPERAERDGRQAFATDGSTMPRRVRCRGGGSPGGAGVALRRRHLRLSRGRPGGRRGSAAQAVEAAGRPELAAAGHFALATSGYGRSSRRWPRRAARRPIRRRRSTA